MADRLCGREARVAVAWPGREPIQMCEAHTNGALRVATAMGFYCATVPVLGETCQSMDRHADDPKESKGDG